MNAITRRDFLGMLGVGAAALGLYGCGTADTSQAARAALPNIVLIFTDDQGYADLGCFGATGFKTPNIDRMAQEGMRFTSFYVSQAVCSASRGALMTGCYSNRVSILSALNPRSVIGINPEEETIAEVLKKRNYATGAFGKWHLGYQKQFLPLQHGFDEFLGLPYSNDMWPVGYDGARLTPENPGPEPWKAESPPLPLIDGNEKIAELWTIEDQSTLTTRLTERAVRFIEKNKDRPFFLYVPHVMPHVPLGVSDKFKGKSEQGMYGDVMMEIDWSVGQILDTLKKHGLDDNTLVIFTSDNGPWNRYGNHAGSAGPLRESKRTAWEGGKRVPCVMRWPGRIPAGTDCDKIASTIDLLPTFAAIAGAPLPERKIDGVNILPLLEGVPNANPRDHFFYYYGHQLRAVREGKWKLVFPHVYPSTEGLERGQDGWPGPEEDRETDLALYDLENDIEERINVADRHPDIVARLQVMGEAMREELGDEGRPGKGIRPSGKVE